VTILSQIRAALQKVLTTVADAAAQDTGFVRRVRKLTGATFVQTLVWGWLAEPNATLEELTQTAASVGVSLSPQGLDRRFGPSAARCLQRVLEAAMGEVIQSEAAVLPILQRFAGVYLLDSSTIGLPDALASVWAGCGGSGTTPRAALKVQVRWEMKGGGLSGLSLAAGRAHDGSSEGQPAACARGALRLADLGYFSLKVLKALDRDGVYWLSRLQAQCAVFDGSGRRQEVVDWLEENGEEEVELRVQLGEQERVACRLLAERVSEGVANQRRRRLKAEAKRRGQTVSQQRLKRADWTLLVTNCPAELLILKEALVLRRVRWQIELLFKLWKSQGKVDEWRSQKPWRILCEVYAKLLAMVVQHWLLIAGCWQAVDRSLHKGAQTVRKHALHVASGLASGCGQRLQEALETVVRCLRAGCRMNRRKTQPNTYQLLLALAEKEGLN